MTLKKTKQTKKPNQQWYIASKPNNIYGLFLKECYETSEMFCTVVNSSSIFQHFKCTRSINTDAQMIWRFINGIKWHQNLKNINFGLDLDIQKPDWICCMFITLKKVFFTNRSEQTLESLECCMYRFFIWHVFYTPSVGTYFPMFFTRRICDYN